MDNYTKPNESGHQENPENLLNGLLIFARTISILLKPNTGIVIDLKGDMKNPVGDSRKVIVINRNNMTVIDDFTQDLMEGTICSIEENPNEPQ